MSVALAHWGRNLLVLALFGLLAEVLLPSRATEGYVRLVVGLVLLAAVVSPVLGVVRGALGTGLGALSGSGGGAGIAAVLQGESTAPAGQATLVAQVFQREVAKAATAAAEAVPGVASASSAARVSQAGGVAYGQLEGVSVAIVARPSAGAAAALAGKVSRAVAQSLGLEAAQVQTRIVRRAASGPAP